MDSRFHDSTSGAKRQESSDQEFDEFLTMRAPAEDLVAKQLHGNQHPNEQGWFCVLNYIMCKIKHIIIIVL